MGGRPGQLARPPSLPFLCDIFSDALNNCTLSAYLGRIEEKQFPISFLQPV
jgi:hypothetical protein